MVEKFKEYLTHSNMAKNTVSAYIYAVNDFNSRHKELTKKNLLLYKTYLIETYPGIEQVSGVFAQATSASKIGEGATTHLFGECHQQC